MERHKDIDNLTLTGTPGSLSGRRMFLVAVLAPTLLLGGWDLIQRTVNGDWARLSFPWEALRPHHAESWGDLVQMAGLPHYERLVNGGDRQKHVVIDSEGFRDSHGADRQVEYLMAGASFFAAGTTNAQTVSGQLEHLTGRPVRNLAWPGGGPVRSIETLVQGGLSTAGSSAHTVIWGVAQRSLTAAGFMPLHARLDASGISRPANTRVQARQTAMSYLRWQHRRLQPFLNETSSLRREASRISKFVPPASLDPGWTSAVTLASYGDRPMVFLNEGIDSAFRSFEDRGGITVVETIERVEKWFADRGVKLIVVLIPDKYEVFRDRLEPDPAPLVADAPDSPVTTEFARALAARGIEVVDLRPRFIAEQKRTGQARPMIYRADDTHWSDRGIRIAAEAIAERLDRGPR